MQTMLQLACARSDVSPPVVTILNRVAAVLINQTLAVRCVILRPVVDMNGSVLEVSYALNEARSKLVSVAHDPEASFEVFVWLYKAGAPKIKLSDQDWKTLLSLKDDADVHFKEKTYTFRQFAVCNNITCSFAESYGKRLICIEHFTFPAEPTDRPKSSVRVWLTINQWQLLQMLGPHVDFLFERQQTCVSELRGVFDVLAFTLNNACGHELRRRHGDLQVLENAYDAMNLQAMTYVSDKGLDVGRALHEMRIFCLNQLRDHIKYTPQA